jgi:hypothetical protein
VDQPVRAGWARSVWITWFSAGSRAKHRSPGEERVKVPSKIGVDQDCDPHRLEPVVGATEEFLSLHGFPQARKPARVPLPRRRRPSRSRQLHHPASYPADSRGSTHARSRPSAASSRATVRPRGKIVSDVSLNPEGGVPNPTESRHNLTRYTPRH